MSTPNMSAEVVAACEIVEAWKLWGNRVEGAVLDQKGFEESGPLHEDPDPAHHHLSG